MNKCKKQKMDDSKVKTLIWDNKSLKLIDQRKLPFEEIYVDCKTAEDVGLAIKDMIVRGAPALGVTAAYGAALAARQYTGNDEAEFIIFLNEKLKMLGDTRPTAVNLFWAIDRMKGIVKRVAGKHDSSSPDNGLINAIKDSLAVEAQNIEREDIEINLRLGQNGASIFSASTDKLKILTHCNAGALATAGYGTALGVIRSLHSVGKVSNVIVDETRPYLQGARLTAWELYRDEIPFFVISDNMSGYFMSKGMVDIVVVGADRVAANGDTANKIGTLSVSILAKYFSIPFYIAAPVSTIDVNTIDGTKIPIEQRDDNEVREILGKRIIPDYIPVANPSFDVTPNENISAIITEKGVIYPPFKENIKNILGKIN
jgi:methylthioribose-1-phosphate isomerase